MTFIDQPPRVAEVISCPTCSTGSLDSRSPDPRGMVRCTHCGAQAFTGYVAEVGTLVAYRTQVERRLDWLTQQIRSAAPAPTVAATRAPVPASVPVAGSRPAPAMPVVPAAQLEGASILLGLGTALLVVAAIVFVAVVWTRIGALGQATVLTSLSLGLGALAVRLRRRLPATAEALAVTSLGILAIEVLAAPRLGLVGIDEPSWGGWWPVFAWTLVGLVGAGAGWAYGLRAWTALGWLSAIPATGFLALSVARHADWEHPATTSGLGAVVAIVAGLLLLSVPTKQRWAMASGFIVLGGAAVVSPMAVIADGARPSWLLAGVVAVSGLAAQRGRLVVGPSSRVAWELAVALTAALSAALAVLPADATQLGWAVAAAALGAASVVAGVRLGRVSQGYSAASCLWLSWIAGRVLQETPFPTGTLAVQVVVVLGVAAAVLLVDAQVGRRPELAWIGAGVGIAATTVAVAHVQAGAIEALTLPAAGLLLAAGLVWRGQRGGTSVRWCGPATAVALIPSALATWTDSWSPESSEHLVRLAGVLVVSAALTIVGSRLRWTGMAIPAAAAFAIAAMAGITDAAQRADLLEAFTLPTAALLLAGGLLLRRHISCGSLVWCGPAAAMALIPSALATWTDWTTPESTGHLTRLAAVLLAGAVMTAIGFRLRWAGLALPAAAAFAIAAMAGITDAAQRVGVLEVFTLPTATLLLGGGLLVRRYVRCGSLVWCGPAVAMALIPSAVVTWTAPWTSLGLGEQTAESIAQLLRLVAVLVAGAVLAILGSRLKWAGLLFPAAAAVGIAATGQIWATAHVLPKWMVLAAVGAVLVTAGARLEWLKGQRVRVEDWAGRLA